METSTEHVRSALASLEEHWAALEGPGLHFWTVSVPLVALEHALDGATLANGSLWADAERATGFAAFGTADRISIRGADTHAQLRDSVAALPTTTEVCGAALPPNLKPRYFGGIAFVPGSTQETHWSEFGDADFILPRWTYARDEATAFLILAVTDGTGYGKSQARSDLAALLIHLATTERAHAPHATLPSTSVTFSSLETWISYIEAIRETLQKGMFRKLVAARRTKVELPPHKSDTDVLRRLRAEMAQSLRFCFRRSNAAFIGATPETLFRKEGSRVLTEALAGTVRSTGTDMPQLQAQSKRLLASEKDLREHAFVVEQISRSLMPLSSALEHEDGPRIRKVRNILHLNTPIAATLDASRTWVDLIGMLHPTPAVGGLPQEGAAEWIAKHEAEPRGWYAAPVGWFTLDGDAHFAVALRSGVIAHPHAYLYSGAGIVEDSDPLSEYAETALKLMPMLTALGVETASLRSTMSPPRF